MLELTVLHNISIKISAMSLRDYSLLLEKLSHRDESETTPAELRDDVPEGGFISYFRGFSPIRIIAIFLTRSIFSYLQGGSQI